MKVIKASKDWQEEGWTNAIKLENDSELKENAMNKIIKLARENEATKIMFGEEMILISMPNDSEENQIGCQTEDLWLNLPS